MGLNYEFNENLKFNVEVRRRFNNFISNSRVAFGGLDLPSFSESNFRFVQNEIYGQVTYNKRFNDLDVNALVGYQMQQNRFNQISASTVGLSLIHI